MRTGLIGRKVGMTRVFEENGDHVPVTVIEIDQCEVVAHRVDEKEGYNALQLGASNAKVKNVKKPQKGHFAKAKVLPKRKLAEFVVSNDAFVDVGSVLLASHFVEGQYVDVVGKSIGKGFAGVMKRHNFAGLRASHGISKVHRSGGSTGQCQDPGRVFKGKKMAGHMGDARVTLQNLKVVRVDDENNLIMIKGGIPGAKGSYVTIHDSIKKKLPDNLPFPAAVKQDAKPVEKEQAPAQETAAENNASENTQSETSDKE